MTLENPSFTLSSAIASNRPETMFSRGLLPILQRVSLFLGRRTGDLGQWRRVELAWGRPAGGAPAEKHQEGGFSATEVDDGARSTALCGALRNAALCSKKLKFLQRCHFVREHRVRKACGREKEAEMATFVLRLHQRRDPCAKDLCLGHFYMSGTGRFWSCGLFMWVESWSIHSETRLIAMSVRVYVPLFLSWKGLVFMNILVTGVIGT
ncbi:hypothetical protein K2173_020100 [Erythroxylum novogranatense]|uniref:Uncharacterized protein n=1 Tax=Erythroxylum novogranatense TaxID=1862640 RepID=A0AAV8U886_9ROSI|nr:hypothetical protein K2173_020100 [Erythroxylum novogranatense]